MILPAFSSPLAGAGWPWSGPCDLGVPVPFGIDELLAACPSTFVTLGQLHPACPIGTIISPHVSHITPLISDCSTLVLGLLFLELPDD